MANTQSSKGNPASHRMGNANLKARRAASWQRGQDRKLQRQKWQDSAHKRNIMLRSEGKLTPWQAAKAHVKVPANRFNN